MRLLTIAAVAAVAAGIYHYRQQRRRPGRAERQPGISDELLAERVRAGIAGAASSPVEVRVVNGSVALHGTVRRAERDLVLAAALAVPGVSRVTNRLEVEGPAAAGTGAERGPMKSGMTHPLEPGQP